MSAAAKRPSKASGAAERDEAALAGGASAGPVGEAPEDPPEREVEASFEPEGEEVGVAELAPEVMDAVLLAPLVALTEKVLRLSEAEAEAVLLMAPLFMDDDDSALSSKMAWMRISWH